MSFNYQSSTKSFIIRATIGNIKKKSKIQNILHYAPSAQAHLVPDLPDHRFPGRRGQREIDLAVKHRRRDHQRPVRAVEYAVAAEFAKAPRQGQLAVKVHFQIHARRRVFGGWDVRAGHRAALGERDHVVRRRAAIHGEAGEGEDAAQVVQVPAFQPVAGHRAAAEIDAQRPEMPPEALEALVAHAGEVSVFVQRGRWIVPPHSKDFFAK